MDFRGTEMGKERMSGNCVVARVFRPVGRLSADNKDEAAASPAPLDILN